jgi:UDP-3-O-acyl-N-acetylglucosamine deacetylase
LTGTLSDAAPILWQYGALARLQPGEPIDKLLHGGYSTISLGYAGLWETVYYLNGKTSMVILPDKDLNITYSVNYDHNDLRNRWVSFDKKNIEEIIEARTFGFYKDLKTYQKLGFAQGVTIDNTVGLTDEGYTTELRSEHEPIKHKILDMFGDLYQTGVSPLNMKCQILVKEAGHAVHIKVANILKDKLVKI